VKVHRITAFTKDGLGGNPAGVVLADVLPDPKVMQRIAAEVGYSETVFSAPMGDQWQTRYFSPETEVPFCGHATIALGYVLATKFGAGEYQLSLAHGAISVRADLRDGKGHSILRSPPTRSKRATDALTREALALFGYGAADLDPALPVMKANAGADHLILPLRSRVALSAMRYNLDAGRAFMRKHELVTVALVWRETDRQFHVRNAFASGGVPEDPATGAAAAALAGMLRDGGWLEAGKLIILQGEDMGRPSLIEVTFTDAAGSPVLVGGTAAVISQADDSGQ
jgi:PhzF family phenazine biosynthesis protein